MSLGLLLVLLAAPPTLGDGLRAVGAFDPLIDTTLEAPPPPARTIPKLVMGAGGGMVVAGLLGMLLSPTCGTHDAQGRCIDARGSHPVFPVLIVTGLATATVGSYWFRRSDMVSVEE